MEKYKSLPSDATTDVAARLNGENNRIYGRNGAIASLNRSMLRMAVWQYAQAVQKYGKDNVDFIFVGDVAWLVAREPTKLSVANADGDRVEDPGSSGDTAAALAEYQAWGMAYGVDFMRDGVLQYFHFPTESLSLTAGELDELITLLLERNGGTYDSVTLLTHGDGGGGPEMFRGLDVSVVGEYLAALTTLGGSLNVFTVTAPCATGHNPSRRPWAITTSMRRRQSSALTKGPWQDSLSRT